MPHPDEPIHGADDIPLLVRSRMPGMVGLAAELGELGERESNELYQQFALAKSLRASQANAVTYALTPQRAAPGEWEVVQQVLPDAAASAHLCVLAGARRTRPSSSLRGIQPRPHLRGALGRSRHARPAARRRPDRAGLEIVRAPESAAQVLVLEPVASADPVSAPSARVSRRRAGAECSRTLRARPPRRRSGASKVSYNRQRLPIEARVFIAALAFRVFSALVAFLANVAFPPYQDQGFSVFRQDHLFWDAFARYDSGWYHGIASQGYIYGAGGRNNLAFFPVYPLLMRAGGTLLGGRQEDYYFAGIVISWLAFAGAMTMLYRLALLDLPRPGGAARRDVCGGVPVRVLLRHGLFGERVPARAGGRGLRAPHPALAGGGGRAAR